MCETASIIELGEALPAGVRRTRYTGIIRHLSILRLKPSFRLKNRVKNSAICCSSVAHGLLIFKQRGRHVACFYVSDSKNERGRDQTPRRDFSKFAHSRKSSGVVTVKYIRFFIFLLLLVISGCSSVLQNSETFYRDHPPGPIRWHEYED